VQAAQADQSSAQTTNTDGEAEIFALCDAVHTRHPPTIAAARENLLAALRGAHSCFWYLHAMDGGTG
jgi:hypothetical protein